MLSEEQRSFLMELQEELNTQDTVGQADPRFWVVRETVTDPCFDEDAEEWRIYDEDGYAVGHASCALEVEGHTCVPVHKVDRNAQNTMFLTLRECKEHIERNSYHYEKPRPYAMTAWRSPQVEKLIEILQTADWGDA